ncbi:MAG: type II toxin-antitoxin system VapC family toxin [Nitrospinae bacterium]|nr:type II toxin-antitoxin system VapC family toxin [Nitrospinota bacterium]
MIFFDTSALVKRYVEESGSGFVEKMFSSGETLSVSILAYAETLSALARRAKIGDVSVSALKTISASFEADWKRMLVIPLGSQLVFVASDVDLLSAAKKEGLEIRNPQAQIM